MASVTKRKWTYKGAEKTAWMVRYVDRTGARRGKTFEYKKDADAYRRKVESEIENGIHTPEGVVPTVPQLAQQFVAHMEVKMLDGRIGRSHFERTRLIFKKHIVPFFGPMKISALSWQDVERWHDDQVRKGLAGKTIKQNLSALRMMESFAVKRGMAQKSIVLLAGRELSTPRMKVIRTFKLDEIGALLRTAATRAPNGTFRAAKMMNIIVNLAAFCGLRYGEIVGLTWPNVNLDERVLSVRHSLTQYDELKGPKTRAGIRDVPLPAHIAELLREWRTAGYMPNKRDLIFRVASKKGPKTDRPIPATKFHDIYWHPLLRRAGIGADEKGRYPHFHALRHFAASWMIENGMSLPEVAELMGHRQFDVTLQVYTHAIIAGSRRSEAMDRMSNALVAFSKPAIETAPAVLEVLSPANQRSRVYNARRAQARAQLIAAEGFPVIEGAASEVQGANECTPPGEESAPAAERDLNAA